MASEDSLEQLSTAELHDLAVRRARHHMDARFFWRLMEVLPVAEAAPESCVRRRQMWRP